MNSYERAISNGVDLSALPSGNKNGKISIDWKNSVGCSVKIHKEYKDKKYNGKVINLTVIIDKYDKATRKLYFVGYKKGIGITSLLQGNIGEFFVPTQPIAVTHPDKIKYFSNTEDAYKYSAHSNKKVNFKCPFCGATREMKISTLTKYDFSCPLCGDGVSIPEKFFANVLTQLGIEFKKQHHLGINNHFMYDFYLPTLDIIIETHGEQHYMDSEWGTYEEEHFNDLLKLDNADFHGYKLNEKYFVINTRHSELEWLNNTIKTLKKLFNFSNVDWEQVFINCQSSYIVRTWELRNEGYGKTEIQKILENEGIKLCSSVIAIYLRRGDKLGKCHYNGKEEMIKNGMERSKAIIGIHTETKEIIEFPSTTEAQRHGFHSGAISECCNGKRELHKGYKWYYKEDYIKLFGEL